MLQTDVIIVVDRVNADDLVAGHGQELLADLGGDEASAAGD